MKLKLVLFIASLFFANTVFAQFKYLGLDTVYGKVDSIDFYIERHIKHNDLAIPFFITKICDLNNHTKYKLDKNNNITNKYDCDSYIERSFDKNDSVIEFKEFRNQKLSHKQNLYYKNEKLFKVLDTSYSTFPNIPPPPPYVSYYTYNKIGLLVSKNTKRNSVDSSSSKFYKISYKYDSLNRLVMKTTIDSSEKNINYKNFEEYFYNEIGQLVSKRNKYSPTNSNNFGYSIHKYSYFKKKLTEEYLFVHDTVLWEYTKYQYDGLGRMIKWEKYEKNLDDFNPSLTYTYDKEKSKIKGEYFYRGQLTYVLSNFQYDNQNNLIELDICDLKEEQNCWKLKYRYVYKK